MLFLPLYDFGLSKLDAADRLSFLEIVDDRWGKTSTVEVAQRPFDTWHEILPGGFHRGRRHLRPTLF